MEDVRIEEGKVVPKEAVLALYAANGWTAYTRDPDRLMRALAGSTRVVTAWRGEGLVGLARVISDGEVVVYLQDVLVLPELQGHGLGRRLTEAAFAPFADVRQHVLLTDGTPQQRAFYTALGLLPAHEHVPAVVAYVRLK